MEIRLVFLIAASLGFQQGSLALRSSSALDLPPPFRDSTNCSAGELTFKPKDLPLPGNSSVLCAFQNLRLALQGMWSLAMATPHTDGTICRLEYESDGRFYGPMKIWVSDYDASGNCVKRAQTDEVTFMVDPVTNRTNMMNLNRTPTASRPNKTYLLYQDFFSCMILLTPEMNGTYCEAYVRVGMEYQPIPSGCHFIFKVYCGFGRVYFGNKETSIIQASPRRAPMSEPFRLLVDYLNLPLRDIDTLLTEFQIAAEFVYKIPHTKLWLSNQEVGDRLCEISLIDTNITALEANVTLKKVINNTEVETNETVYFTRRDRSSEYLRTYITWNRSLTDYDNSHVVFSDYVNCTVLLTRKEGSNETLCELFVRHDYTRIWEPKHCWFAFYVYCGPPKANYQYGNCSATRPTEEPLSPETQPITLPSMLSSVHA